MIQLKLTLDKRRIKKDNTYPLVYRIGANRKSFYLSTGASILEKFWDDKRQQIKLKSVELEMLASRLRSKEIQLLQKIQEYESGYSSVCIAHLKNHLLYTSIIVLKNKGCVRFKCGFSTQVINDSD